MSPKLQLAEIHVASRRDVDDLRVALSAELAAAGGAVIARLDRGARRAVLTLSLLMVATAAAVLILAANS
jgi:hypothetical protein